MAFPAVAGRAESATTTASTSHTVSLPGSIAAGDLLLIFFGHAVSCSLNALAGWTELDDTVLANAQKILYRWADGSEGATVGLTTSANTKSAHLSFRITGAENPSVQAPEATETTGTSATPDPGGFSPTGGAKDYLWLACFVQAGEEADDDTWCNSPPTDFGNLVQITSGTAAAASTNVSVAAADRQFNASTLNPGTFSTDQSLAWRAWNIVIHPAGPPSELPLMSARRSISIPA